MASTDTEVTLGWGGQKERKGEHPGRCAVSLGEPCEKAPSTGQSHSRLDDPPHTMTPLLGLLALIGICLISCKCCMRGGCRASCTAASQHWGTGVAVSSCCCLIRAMVGPAPLGRGQSSEPLRPHPLPAAPSQALAQPPGGWPRQ